MLFEVIYTSIAVPCIAMPYAILTTKITHDFKIFSKLIGYKEIFNKLTNFLAAFISG
ncbi:MAG: hypothetical protein ACFC03_00310 [Candidatus Malihini olakiniferum]